MSGLFASISSASSSLQAHTRSLEQSGKNLANINNPNYARQRVTLGSQPNGTGTSSGLTVTGIEHARDSMLDRQLLGEISLSAGLDSKHFRLNQALASLGESIDRMGEAKFIDEPGRGSDGLRNSIDTFFNSFESFASRPNDAASRQLLLKHAQNLVQDFNRIDGRLSAMQEDLDREVAAEVDVFNRHLDTLDTLNREIAKVELARPGSALDLRDQRQATLEQLSELANIQVREIPGTNGQISVAVTGSDGESRLLVEPGQPVNRLEIDPDDGSFRVAGIGDDVVFGAGRLAALVQVRDGDIQRIRDEIDQMAAALAGDVNQIYQATGSLFFDPGDLTAGGLRLHGALTTETLTGTATGISGANEIALEIAALAGAKHADLNNNSYSQFAVSIVTKLGQDVQTNAFRREVQANVREMIQARRDEVSGVSLDEEVAHLMQAQRAFQASARVFNTISELLETVVNGLGR